MLYKVSLWIGKDKYEGSLQTWKYGENSLLPKMRLILLLTCSFQRRVNFSLLLKSGKRVCNDSTVGIVWSFAHMDNTEKLAVFMKT